MKSLLQIDDLILPKILVIFIANEKLTLIQKATTSQDKNTKTTTKGLWAAGCYAQAKKVQT